jgi:hypothetical protein
MSQYVKCLKNDTYFADDLADIFFDLEVGQIYKQLPLHAEEEGSGMVRVVDSSSEAYLYPANYFEPVQMAVTSKPTSQQVTVHLDEITKGILHAEALAAKKSVSALLREWIDERLDLLVGGD